MLLWLDCYVVGDIILPCGWKLDMVQSVLAMETCLGFERHIAHRISPQLFRNHQIRRRGAWVSIVSTPFRCFSRSRHIFPCNMLDIVKNYVEASMFEGPNSPDKVSKKTGYNFIKDFIHRDGSRRDTELDIKCLISDFNLLLACERFPSVVLGDSPLTELYNGAHEIAETCKSAALEEQFVAWSSVGTQFSNESLSTHAEKEGLVSENSKIIISSDQDICNTYLVDGSITAGDTALDISLTSENTLDRSIRCVPGITNRQCNLLEIADFHTVRKLLNHFPRTYADLVNAHDAIEDGQYLILVGTVLSSRANKAGSLCIHEVIVTCELAKDGQGLGGNNGNGSSGDMKNIHLHLKKYFRGIRFTCIPFLQKLQSTYKKGDRIYVTGKVKKMNGKGHYEMGEYSVDMLEEEEETDAHVDGRPYPLYPSKAGMKPVFLREIILRTLKQIQPDIDPLPGHILKEFNLLGLYNTYLGIHCPRTTGEADEARRRLIFDEFFYLQLARLYQMIEALGTRSEKKGLLEKYRNQRTNAVASNEWSSLTKKFVKSLPFSLTPSQENAVSEIIWDLKRLVPMNRLLQGEVGCGKTIVAFMACMEVIAAGFQAAFMVPTELLAIQHYQQLLTFLDNIVEDQQKPSIALLTGSMSAKQTKAIRQGLLSGDISMVIGTHSLLSEKIDFYALRIAVIDEQHRFGVTQRGRFNSKLYSVSTNIDATNCGKPFSDKVYMAPHVLAMSATPIPRTLALALYGDMSLTEISGTIPGRQSIETHVLEGNEKGFERVYQMMRDELMGGGKVYLVFPVIEESEQLPQLHAAAKDLEFISAKFEGYQCGLLHGRMKGEEKDEALRQFKSGNTQILLSTLVIEIGIDVPDASMMVVMNAERFGIAQLHQLRGRVGRGTKKSRCVFLSSTASSLGRLKVLEKSTDGFSLAKFDLMFRGPGDLLGKKQSGHLPEFPVARLEIDGNILQEAHHAALNVLSCSHDLQNFPRLKAELSMRQPLCLLGD